MFTINASYLLNWYSIFYLISSVLTFLVLLYMGWRKGYPLLSWILILVTGSLFFIIGTKLPGDDGVPGSIDVQGRRIPTFG